MEVLADQKVSGLASRWNPVPAAKFPLPPGASEPHGAYGNCAGDTKHKNPPERAPMMAPATGSRSSHAPLDKSGRGCCERPRLAEEEMGARRGEVTRPRPCSWQRKLSRGLPDDCAKQPPFSPGTSWPERSREPWPPAQDSRSPGPQPPHAGQPQRCKETNPSRQTKHFLPSPKPGLRRRRPCTQLFIETDVWDGKRETASSIPMETEEVCNSGRGNQTEKGEGGRREGAGSDRCLTFPDAGA